MSLSRFTQLFKEAEQKIGKTMMRRRSRSPPKELIKDSSLFHICAFLLQNRGNLLSEADLQTLENVCLALNPDDIGCSEPPSSLWKQYSRASGRPLPVIWSEIYEDAHFSLTIFRMPKNSLLPLHDHKGMCGINHVIHGKLWYEAFTWINQKDGLCKLEKVGETTNSEPCIKTVPDAGNIHMIGALEDTTVFQILCPPYDNYSRPCDYYEVSPVDQNEKLYRIQPTMNVDYYVCDSIQYTGLDFREIYAFAQAEFEVRGGAFFGDARAGDARCWPIASPRGDAASPDHSMDIDPITDDTKYSR